MEDDDDLAGALPPSPPPRPVRREAAVDAAMARFDGSSAPPSPEPARRRGGFRPQLAGVATVALIGLVSVPLWLSGTYRHPATEATTTNVTVAEPKLVTADVAPESKIAPDAAVDRAIEPPPAMVAPSAVAAPPPTRSDTRTRPSREAGPEAEAIAPAPPPPPPPPPPMPVAAPPAAMAVPSAGYVANRAAAPRQIASRVVADEEIMVTGARVSPTPRGDWNACTIDDPRRDPARCRHVAREGSDAAAGLASGWQHDDDDAIAAFDRAVATAPKSAFVHLNRGLAYARRGDFTRALADLDAAVRLRPDTAQGYFQRARILRRLGEDGRASADERRALALDRRYAKVLKPAD